MVRLKEKRKSHPLKAFLNNLTNEVNRAIWICKLKIF